MARSPNHDAIFSSGNDEKAFADHQLLLAWRSQIKHNLDTWFSDRPNVLVAGNMPWYPVLGEPRICAKPMVFVVFSRPKGTRTFYQQWKEANLPPQVVFEILSPENTLKAMAKTFAFYDQYGVEEYYLYDPLVNDLNGWRRSPSNRLVMIPQMQGWVSPRLGIHFELNEGLRLYFPNGAPFLPQVA